MALVSREYVTITFNWRFFKTDQADGDFLGTKHVRAGKRLNILTQKFYKIIFNYNHSVTKYNIILKNNHSVFSADARSIYLFSSHYEIQKFLYRSNRRKRLFIPSSRHEAFPCIQCRRCWGHESLNKNRTFVSHYVLEMLW